MTQLSWKPPAVTKCDECPCMGVSGSGGYCEAASTDNDAFIAYTENKNGITKTCPMWQQQNKGVV